MISKFSFFKIQIDKTLCVDCKKCEIQCPVSCIDSKNGVLDNENCLRCYKCFSVCSLSALKISIHKKDVVAFSEKRRKFVVMAASVGIFSFAMCKSKLYLDKLFSKIKNIILPPGAVSSDYFLHKCNNCNLCIEVCPTNIIVKSNFEVPFVHLDFNRGYCKENCNKCSHVCPTGALSKLSIEQKKKIKIGLAKIVSEKCTHCDLCVKACPYNAITKEFDKLPIIDTSKCIGCGACKSVCASETIDIFAIDPHVNI